MIPVYFAKSDGITSELIKSSITRYSTMDNVDGKQARRTGTSSGLGELFE